MGRKPAEILTAVTGTVPVRCRMHEQPKQHNVRTYSDEARVRGLEFTAHRLAVQLDLLIMAIEGSRRQQEIQDLCREGRVVLDYAATVLGGDDLPQPGA
jgi:hypothetical protein